MSRPPSRSLLSLLSVLSAVVLIGGLSAVTLRSAGAPTTASTVATRPASGRGPHVPATPDADPVHVDTAAAAAPAAPPAAPPPGGAAPAVQPGPYASADAAPTASGGTTSGGARFVADPANSWALLIGINSYQYPTHPTYGGDGDVAAFRDALARAGWQPSHILVLTDGAATGNAIRSSINWLVRHSGPGTFSLFHYSGHVYQQGGSEFLWGDDNQFISNGEFGSAMRGLQGRAWIDVAGCESAGFDSGVSSPLRFVTTSSRVNEKSYERADWKRSVWSGLTVQEGMINRQADGNGDGSISIQEAVRWAQKQAPTMTANQTPYGPQHPYAVGGDGDWYLGPAVAPPPPPPPPPSSQGGGSGQSGGSTGQCNIGTFKCQL